MPTQEQTPKARFSLGKIYATPGALAALEEAEETVPQLLHRHVIGDWGDLVEEDKLENEFGLQHRLRIFSAYKLSTDTKLWVITEADRSVTTLLLPSEY